MRYLFRNPRVFPSLEVWSGNDPGITSGFFFLGSGTELQKSPLGLLRTILYDSLQDMIFGPLAHPRSIIQTLFADRWNQLLSYGGGLHPFTFAELRTAFELLVSDASKKFLFFIDGLDETDDYPSDLIDTILTSAQRENVKFCVSSRPSPVFQSAFETRPRLVVDEYTKDDISHYITRTFNREAKLQTLRGKMDGQEEVNIVATLSDKAAGVFLWATLATSYILRSLTDGDDFLVLKDRADALPYQLDDLLRHIMDRLAPADLEALWKVHMLLAQNEYPGVLPLSFAYTAETAATLVADVRPLKPAETAKRVEDMYALANQRCAGFYAVYDTSPPGSPHPRDPDRLRVTYTHRAIYTFLLANPSIPTPTTTPLSQQQSWVLSALWTLKTLTPPPSPSSPPLRIWHTLLPALSLTHTIHTQTSTYPLTLTHALLSTAVFQALRSSSGSDLPGYPGAAATQVRSALDVAVWLNMRIYVGAKIRGLGRADVRRAGEFAREMGRRVGGVGGQEEERWFSGRGAEGVRREWAAGREEVDGLVEWWGKVVRLGGGPVVEGVECV